MDGFKEFLDSEIPNVENDKPANPEGYYQNLVLQQRVSESGGSVPQDKASKDENIQQGKGLGLSPAQVSDTTNNYLAHWSVPFWSALIHSLSYHEVRKGGDGPPAKKISIIPDLSCAPGTSHQTSLSRSFLLSMVDGNSGGLDLLGCHKWAQG